MGQPAASARPDSRALLLRAGWELAKRQGLRALTVRAVAARAGANLGTFVYHFGTRDAFLRELVEAWYAPLLAGVELAATDGPGPLGRLRAAVLTLVEFGREHGGFLGRLIMDAVAGERAARDFLGSIAGRHPAVLLRLIRSAQTEQLLVEQPPLEMLLFILASVGLPVLLAGLGSGPSLLGPDFGTALARAARDRDCVERRLDWALRGLAPEAA